MIRTRFVNGGGVMACLALVGVAIRKFSFAEDRVFVPKSCFLSHGDTS
ncbi:MAG: hypothetical protein H7061_00845 [Bdellovibrionaceae bacterium]|nr:hypothetical protein [Bdellovibrio sp.]